MTSTRTTNLTEKRVRLRALFASDELDSFGTPFSSWHGSETFADARQNTSSRPTAAHQMNLFEVTA